MRSPTFSIGAAFFLAAASTALGQSPSAESAAPHLRRDGPAVQLVVDGKPFLILGGELLNSSSSSREHMQAVWPRLAAMSLNTVLTPVSWDMIEPAEGRYDFRLVDGLIQDARAQNLHLVLLWLASWKNGMSCYMPLWVKQDCDRFPRVPDGSGAGRELLSTLSDANRNADARAFAALMRHLRGFDGSAHTVLMIQVENEVGILGDSRDRSVAANSAFAAPVPAALMSYLEEHRDALLPELRTLWDGAGGKASGSWQEVFGPGLATDEIFMAWNYARYVGYVAAAGKAEYALPMYANAWLRQPYFLTPGTYPSGGPQAELMDVWHAGAPAIDILAPDLYGPNFTEWCFKYQREGNPLFLPETESGPEAGARVFYVLGAHDGLGFSPFGIDMPAERLGPDLGQSYAILSQLAPLILESRGLGRMTGFSLDKAHPTASASFGGYSLEIALDSIFGRTTAKGYGLIVAAGPGEFVGAGRGFMVRFKPNGGLPLAGLGRVEEGTYRDGRWIPGRRLNGDETDQGGHWRFSPFASGIQRCTVYQYR